MKLTQFAFAAILVLLLVAGYLTVKSDLDSRRDAQDELNKQMLSRLDELAWAYQRAGDTDGEETA